MPDILSSFAPLLATLDAAGPTGLRIEAWGPVSVAATMAYRGAEGAAGERLSAFGRSASDAKILTIGPGTWLILRNKHALALPNLDDVAVTFDQGDGYALLRMCGTAAITVLQKGIFIDLHSALAADDSCVSSVIAHINVTAWRVSSDTFGVAVPRSYAGSFWHWLSTAAAAEGVPLGR